MTRIWAVTDPDACRQLWVQAIPQEHVADLWEVRECFHHHYRRQRYFVAAEDGGSLTGLLPLSWIPERSCYAYFPGETWHNETWLEQNRIIAQDGVTLARMIEFLENQGARYQLRYLLPSPLLQEVGTGVDENGYLFHPPRFDFNVDNFFGSFSRKAGKKILKAVNQFDACGVDVRLDALSDFDWMVQMNVDRFGSESYFADHRFTEGFRDLMHFLRDRGWLRMTTILVEGQVAAVDMGCIYNDVYTLFAGGTNPGFLGIAKYINLYHMRRACRERLGEVDFLCGDFGWKPMFHLTPRPLYKMSNFEEAPPLIEGEFAKEQVPFREPHESRYEKSDA